MLYIIGLGLNLKGISLEGLEAIKKSKKIYLENYTMDFPYSKIQLEKTIGKKIISADREFIESCKIVDEAKKQDVSVLVYGSPLTATTHIILIQKARNSDIKYQVIYSSSIMDGIAETGLQLYKFGKTTSIPGFEADSFMEIIKENRSINAHSLILVDIGLDFKTAIEKLRKAAEVYNVKLDKILICSEIGTKNKRIIYADIDKLGNMNFNRPFCIIIPGKLHFMEKEILEEFLLIN